MEGFEAFPGCYYLGGKFHRLGGPASIYDKRKYWYLSGVPLTKLYDEII